MKFKKIKLGINKIIIMFLFLLVLIPFSFSFNFECLDVSNFDIDNSTSFSVFENTSFKNENLKLFIKPFFEQNYSSFDFYNIKTLNESTFKIPTNYYYYINNSIYSSSNFCIHKESYKRNDSILTILEKFITYDDASIYNIAGDVYYKDSVINLMGIINYLDLYEVTLNSSYLDIAIELENSIEENFGIDSHIDIFVDGKYNIKAKTSNYYSWEYIDRAKIEVSEIHAFLIKSFLKLYEDTYNNTYLQKAINAGNSINNDCNFTSGDFNCNHPISQELLVNSYYDLYTKTHNQTYFDIFKNLTKFMYEQMNFQKDSIDYNYSFYIASKLCNMFNFNCSRSDSQQILDSLDNQIPVSFFQIFQKISYLNDKFKFDGDIENIRESFRIFQYLNFSNYYDESVDFGVNPFNNAYGFEQNLISMSLMKIYENYDSSDIVYDYEIIGELEYKKNITILVKSFFSNDLSMKYYKLDSPESVFIANHLQNQDYHYFTIDESKISPGIIVLQFKDNFLEVETNNLSYRFSYGIKKANINDAISAFKQDDKITGLTCNLFDVSTYEKCKIENNKGNAIKMLYKMGNYFFNTSSYYVSYLNNFYVSFVDVENAYNTCDYNRNDFICQDVSKYDYINYFNTNKVLRFVDLVDGLLNYYSLNGSNNIKINIYKYLNNNFENDCDLKSNFLCNVSFEDNSKIVNLFYKIFEKTGDYFYLEKANLGYNQLKLNNSNWNSSANFAILENNLRKYYSNISITNLEQSYEEQINYCNKNNCDYYYYYDSFNFLYNFYLQSNQPLVLKKVSTYFQSLENINFECNPMANKYNCIDASQSFKAFDTLRIASYVDYIAGDLNLSLKLHYNDSDIKNYSDIVNLTCEYYNTDVVATDVIVFSRLSKLSSGSLLNVYINNNTEVVNNTRYSYMIPVFNTNEYVNVTFEVNLSYPLENIFECVAENFTVNKTIIVENFTEELDVTFKDKNYFYNINDSYIFLNSSENTTNLTINDSFINISFLLKNPFYFSIDNLILNISTIKNISNVSLKNTKEFDEEIDYSFDYENKTMNISKLLSNKIVNITFSFNKTNILDDESIIFNITERFGSLTNFNTSILIYNESNLFFEKIPKDVNYYLDISNNDFIFYNINNYSIEKLNFYIERNNNFEIVDHYILNNSKYIEYNNTINSLKNKTNDLYAELINLDNLTIQFESSILDSDILFFNFSGNFSRNNITLLSYMNYSFGKIDFIFDYDLENSINENWILLINVTNNTNEINIYNSTLNKTISIIESLNESIFEDLSNLSFNIYLKRNFNYYNLSKEVINNSNIILNFSNNQTIYNLDFNLSSSPNNHTYFNDSIIIEYDFLTNFYSNSSLIIYKNISNSFVELCSQEINNITGIIRCNNDSFSKDFKIFFNQSNINITREENISNYYYNSINYNKDTFVYSDENASQIKLFIEKQNDSIIFVNDSTIYFNFSSKNETNFLIYFNEDINNNCSFVDTKLESKCNFNLSYNVYKNGFNITFLFLNDSNYTLNNVFLNQNITHLIYSQINLKSFKTNYNYEFKEFVKSNITFDSINLKNYEEERRIFNNSQKISYLPSKIFYEIGPILENENFTFRLVSFPSTLIENFDINFFYFINDSYYINTTKSDYYLLNKTFNYTNDFNILDINTFVPSLKYLNEEFEVNISINNLINNDLNNSKVTINTNANNITCNKNLSNSNLFSKESFDIVCILNHSSNIVFEVVFNNTKFNYSKTFNYNLLSRIKLPSDSDGGASGSTSGGSSGGFTPPKSNQTNISNQTNQSTISEIIDMILREINEFSSKEIIKLYEKKDLENLSINYKDKIIEEIKKEGNIRINFFEIIFITLISAMIIGQLAKGFLGVTSEFSIESIQKIIYNSISELLVKHVDNPDLFFKRYLGIKKKIANIEKKGLKINPTLINSSKFKLLKYELMKATDYIKYFNYKNEMRIKYQDNIKEAFDVMQENISKFSNMNANINEKKFLIDEAKKEYIEKIRHEKIYYKSNIKGYINDLVQRIENRTLKDFFKTEYNKIDGVTIKNIDKYINEANKHYDF
ncbi:MAG: hypothetical protein PHT94_01950 [Candidatus Nanoarchaeia archaeon]|nr:hypothetical protein [Candidatus Nanoarchaeia archaeon]